MEAAMEDDTFSLIIIDSLMALWRNDYVGRGELSERQQKLGTFLNLLKKISERHNVAVVYTNLVMSDPGAGKHETVAKLGCSLIIGMSYVPDPKKAIGGHVVAHASTVRLFLRKVCKQLQAIDYSHLTTGTRQ